MQINLKRAGRFSRLVGVGLGSLVLLTGVGTQWFKGVRLSQLSSAETVEVSASSQTIQPTVIYAVSPDLLAIALPAPAIRLGQQQTYQAEPGDRTVNRGNLTRLIRQRTPLGILVGARKDILYSFDEITGQAIAPVALDQPANYEITSSDDANYRQSQSPTTLFRKSKPAAMARMPDGDRRWPAEHTLFLSLPEPMEPGATYQIDFAAMGIAPGEFTFDPMQSPSEAVHVSHIGFRPDDPLKVGYLSTWIGPQLSVDFEEGLRFRLIETGSEEVAFVGQATLQRGHRQIEDERDRDYTQSEVHRLDFSSVTRPGEYRLCVETVGCSVEFTIGDAVWGEAFRTSARGYYHQRSGIEIGPPHSRFRRPRAFHPDDGLQIYQSTTTLLETRMGLGSTDAFEALLAGKTDEVVTDVWGGYFDAGDWDRRIQHLGVPRYLLELYETFPDYFAQVDLNLPESGNELPDLLDEALWSLDFFSRLQRADGAVSGGVESAGHPLKGEASWQESQTVMAYQPDVWSSYVFAAVAARAAKVLESIDSTKADAYQQRALRAMQWAEENYNPTDYPAGEPRLHRVADERNLAALELYRLTGNDRWHQLFLNSSAFKVAGTPAFVHRQHDQIEAAYLYARMSDRPVDRRVQAQARTAFLRHADGLANLTQRTAFGWTKRLLNVGIGWRHGLGGPAGVDILRAHALTGETRYLEAGVSSTQFALGANPSNMVYTTGLGHRSPQHPLIMDQRITRQAPPPGITLYGPADFTVHQDYWTLDLIEPETHPKPEEWPVVENYFDIYSYPIGAEFTVDYMVAATYTWGYLAAR